MIKQNKKKSIVVLGAGYGGIRVIQRLSTLINNNDYQIVLINQHDYHVLMTQLYEPAVGTGNHKDVMVDLEKVLEGRRVTFVQGLVSGIDLNKRVVLLDSGDTEVSFDYLVIALGSKPEYFGIEGLKENSISLSSLENAREIHRRIKETLKKAAQMPPGQDRQQMLTFVVGGGGLTGVEFAGELAFEIKRTRDQYNISADECKIILVEGSKSLLPGMSNQVANYAQKTLEELGVEVIAGNLLKRVTQETIHLASGREIKYSNLIWSGGVRGNSVMDESGMKTDVRGRLLVNEYLQYLDDSSVYAVGDSAFAKDPIAGHPVLPTAQAAIQHGNLVAYNIYADITGQKKQVYSPGLILLCITVGRGRGLGESKSIRIIGKPAAWLKKIIPLKYFYLLGGFKMLIPLFKGKRG